MKVALKIGAKIASVKRALHSKYTSKRNVHLSWMGTCRYHFHVAIFRLLLTRQIEHFLSRFARQQLTNRN